MSTMFWIWMAAAVVFLIIELLTPTLIFICFTAGSLGAGLYAVGSPDAHYTQLTIFAVVSIVLIPLTRGLAKKITKQNTQVSNVDRMVGQTAVVTQAIDPDEGGKVRFEGEVWVAKADEAIEAQAKVRITGVSGTRVLVERLNQSNAGSPTDQSRS